MTIHEEIAKERYLDRLANSPSTNRAAAAAAAIEDATAFVLEYSSWKASEQAASREFSPATKGCPACFGSGGKKAAPCEVCGGTGRIAAHSRQK